MSSGLKILKEFYATRQPGQAAKSGRGATEVGSRQAESQGTPDYLPLVALLAGVAMLAVAFLRPGPRRGRGVVPFAPPNGPNDGSGGDNEWPTPEPSW